jgi:SAM-dependent methyltransferase
MGSSGESRGEPRGDGKSRNPGGKKRVFFAPRDPDAPRSRPGGPRPQDRPRLGIFTTTLWEYPSQHYTSERVLEPEEVAEGRTRFMQGSRHYEGATPSWVIWQVLKRYTREGQVVVDPFCGSGTTLDVCKDLGRKGLGFDLNPQREAIVKADARKLPVAASSADLVFLDPPYSTHIEYSDDPRCIGKLDAGGDDGGAAYYAAMDAVFAELNRVLRPGGTLALYVSDSWRKRKGGGPGEGTFMPIGFELFARLRTRFTPIDLVAVVRQNQKLDRGNWHKAAEEGNFFLRGFNYLLLFRKAKP